MEHTYSYKNKVNDFREYNSSECSFYPQEEMEVRQPGKYQCGPSFENSNCDSQMLYTSFS